MSPSISRIVVPSLVSISIYVAISKFFPEVVNNLDKYSEKDLKTILKRILKKIAKNRALKIAILSGFATAGIQHFQSEVEKLLVDDVFDHICTTYVDGKLRIVCNIIQEHDLDLHAQSMKSVIIANDLNHEEKISLLKIKLDFIINGTYPGKKRFLIMSLIGMILAFTISGVGGLAIILEALYRLFQEGKISRALYKQIVKALARTWVGRAIPTDYLLDL